MQRVFILIFIFVFSIGGISPALAEEERWTGNVNFFLGIKTLDDDDWEPIEEQGEAGISVDFRQQSWPINLVVEYLHSASDEEDAVVCDSLGCFNLEAEGETSEVNIGFRKIWDSDHTVRPFLGGGVSFMKAEFTLSALGVEVSASDSGMGFWLGGGVYWTLSDHFNLGLEAKLSTADVNFEGIESDAGGFHLGLLAGYHW